MAFELKPGQGSLFKNDRKEKETHPDYKGSININGVEHWLSGWIKRGAKGAFLSLSVGEPKQQRGGGQRHQSYGGDQGLPQHGRDLDDEIPF